LKPTTDIDRAAARIRIVEEHIRHENNHDLHGIMSTFGDTAFYEEQPWRERYEGVGAVREYYRQLIAALPNLHIDVQQRHIAEAAIILEVVITGTHEGAWRGLPATGRPVQFPLCATYTFTPDNRLSGERIYYDRATVFRQLGVYSEATTPSGQIRTVMMHPLVIGRAYGRQVLRRLRRASPGSL
jgi:steroid delta-isomerase-like uncharacterized protein